MKASYYFSWPISAAFLLILFSVSLVALPMDHIGEGNIRPPTRRDFEDDRSATTTLQRLGGVVNEVATEQEGNGYVIVPNTDVESKEGDEEPVLVDIFERKNPLSAYMDFARRQRQIVSHLFINEGGETFLSGSSIPETFGGKACQYIVNNYVLTQNQSFVDDYYETLQKNYGDEIAEKVFSKNLRKTACQFGLSSEIVFNSLKQANLEVIGKFCEQLSLKKLENNNLEIQLSRASHALAQDQLHVLASQIKLLLTNAPDAPIESWTRDHPDTRSALARCSEYVITLVDSGMLASNSVLWFQRLSFLRAILLGA
ncbi:MAG: hypothetical protein FJ390_08160 [Verrucomicrobia bacterium]|nr:hypothetical protein [Verrucomicrobiota bacterium]